MEQFIQYLPHIFSEIDFNQLDKEIEWEQNSCKMMGQTIPLPRETKFFSDPVGQTYSYSGTNNYGNDFESSPTLNNIFQKILNDYQVNVCLLNRYKDGKDYLGWHSDDEKEGVENSSIISVSLGSSRVMQFRKKKGKHPIEREITLNHGDLLIMNPGCQNIYKHSIPKRMKVIKPRINLTFRLFR